jgi:hypothetical protein
MGFRIHLLRSSALQNEGLDVPVSLQCRSPQETPILRAIGAKLWFDKIVVVFLPGGPGMSWAPQCFHVGP